MAQPRSVNDDVRNAEQEIQAIVTQLDRWKVPLRHRTTGGTAGVPMSVLGRIRFMRNVAVETVARLQAENDRLQRLLDAKETKWQSPV